MVYKRIKCTTFILLVYLLINISFWTNIFGNYLKQIDFSCSENRAFRVILWTNKRYVGKKTVTIYSLIQNWFFRFENLNYNWFIRCHITVIMVCVVLTDIIIWLKSKHLENKFKKKTGNGLSFQILWFKFQTQNINETGW